MDASDLSSFKTPSEFGKERFKGFSPGGSEIVKVDTLEQFIKRNGFSKRRILLKMDTQGYDLEVMKGGPNSLSNVLAIQSEISFNPLYENMPTHLESLKAFGGYGFSVADMYPVTKTEDLSVIEMDCIFVKKPA